MYFRLVADVYEKTHTLAINLGRATKEQLDLVDLSDSLFTDYLGEYPEVELKWLSGMYERQVSMCLWIAVLYTSWC